MFQNNVHMFLCFRSSDFLSIFGKWFNTFWKSSSPPYPLEITAFEPSLPLGISNDHLRGVGGMDIFWNHTLQFLVHTAEEYKPFFRALKNLTATKSA